MNTKILDSRTFDMPGDLLTANLEFGQVLNHDASGPDRFYVRIVRGDARYPRGVRNEAFSLSYMKGVWADTVKRYEYIVKVGN
jgi:hypothetical protein